MTTRSALEALPTPVCSWVRDRFGELTPPQQQAIPAIHARRNVLVSAPTGTGKTLAAFLAILGELVSDFESGTLGDGVQAIYISPLRALGADVQRNLERPLAEICEGYLEGCAELEEAPIRVALRTGDTTPAERRRIITKPPHILVTTPESLAILLSTDSMRPHLARTRWIVVDEVHSMAGNKRGAHLCLSLERLAFLVRENGGRDPVRIGLSATVSPLPDVARWLAGARRRIELVEWTAPRDTRYSLESVLTGDVVPNPQRVQRRVAEIVSDRVKANRTTLIFTNTRGATERLAHRLKTAFADEDIAAHHSSLSREDRQAVEGRLREGHLKAVVSSTSLELGIDIGTVDETVLVSSPRDATRALQRIGRSGHRIDRHPAGRFIGTGVDDLLECAAIIDRCRAGVLEPIRWPVSPLDVLAQHLVGMGAEGEWRIDDAFAVIRRATPFCAISRDDFIGVLDYLCETSESMEERRVYAKLERDEECFRARGRSAQTIYFQNVGTISGGASVRVKPRGSATPIGTVEEDFVEQLKPGDRFLLGGRVWSFMYAQGMTAFVGATTGRPSVPRWASEILPASASVARRVGELRASLRDVLLEQGEEGLASHCERIFGIEADDALAITRYISAQHALAPIPDANEIVVDQWTDVDDERVIVHFVTSPLGRRANDALARAIALRAGRSSAGILVDDQAFAIRLPAKARWTSDMLAGLFSTTAFADDVRQAVARTDLWSRRFRQVAATALMLVKNYHGRSKFVGGMQANARRIWSMLERERPEFPLVRETYRTVLQDDLDIGTAERWLKACGRRLSLRWVATPPPFAFRLLAAGTTDAMLLEERDAFVRRLWEEAEQRAAAVARVD